MRNCKQLHIIEASTSLFVLSKDFSNISELRISYLREARTISGSYDSPHNTKKITLSELQYKTGRPLRESQNFP